MERLLKEEEDFIRTYAEEISVDSFAKGIEVDVKYGEYFVKSILLNPDNEFIKDSKINKSEQDTILKLGVQFFSKDLSPEVGCLKLQTLYFSECGSDVKIIRDHNNLLFAYIEPLMQFVIKFEIKNPDVDNPILYRKIVLLIGILSGMGDPSKPKEYEELEAAVNSIISVQQLTAFVCLNSNKKREQILKLAQIVTGVRIYNKQRSKGGSAILNLPSLVKESIEATEVRIQRFMKKYDERIYGLMYSLNGVYYWESNIIKFSSATSPFKETDLRLAKDSLALFYQMIINLKNFLKHLGNIRIERNDAEIDMAECLLQLEDAIDVRAVIPVNVVYPKFYELSLYWTKFQNMVVLLSFYNKVIKTMDNIVKETISKLSENLKDIIQQFENVITNQVNDYKEVIDPKYISQCEIIYPDDNKCMTVALEFNEFCPVYCGETDGMLYKADRLVGILKFADKYYGFKDHQAAQMFSEDPEWYINKILNFARTNLLYIDLLNLRPLLLKLSIDLLLVETDNYEVASGNDFATQTELHPVERNIEKNYKSSIWEWKFELGKMASLIRCKTHSVQTVSTMFKSTAWTQTWFPKNTGAQTGQDVYTQVPKLYSYLYGLRGHASYSGSYHHLPKSIGNIPVDII